VLIICGMILNLMNGVEVRCSPKVDVGAGDWQQKHALLAFWMRPASLDQNWSQAFRSSPYRLRFELGGETFDNIAQPVPRFIQAFHRAQTIANALFSRSTSLTAILAVLPKGEVAAQGKKPFKALKALGFRGPAPWCEWSAPLDPNDDDEMLLDWCAINLTDPAMRDALLWTSIALEMPIRPKAAVLSFLTDFDAGVMLHVYDDRGMDVCAIARPAIERLYRQFDCWLLDYDRPRMAAAFESC
jgi:hypothetical protein